MRKARHWLTMVLGARRRFEAYELAVTIDVNDAAMTQSFVVSITFCFISLTHMHACIYVFGGMRCVLWSTAFSTSVFGGWPWD